MQINDQGLKSVGRIHVEVSRLPYIQRKVMQFCFAIGLFEVGEYLRRTYGVLKSVSNTTNLTMNAQLAVVAGLVGNTGSQVAFTKLALGTSNTAVSASQTTLVAETVVSGLTRASATMDRITTTQTNDTLRFRNTFTAGGSATIEEVGYFNDPTAGVMGGRGLTTSKPLASGDSLAITYTVQYS